MVTHPFGLRPASGRATYRAMSVASPPPPKPRVLVRIVAVAIVLALMVVVGEVSTRAFGILDRLNGYSRLLFVAEPAPGLPYGLRPGVETAFVGVPVRVDADGCRGPARSPDPPAGGTVLLLGDSVVFGQGVVEGESVAGRLAAHLGDVAVVNCGVPGFETTAEARQLSRLAPRLHPRVTVVGMSLNDYDRAPRFHPLGVLSRSDDSPAEGILARSELVMLLRWIWTWARGGLWQQMVERSPEPAPNADELRKGLDRLVATEHARFYASPDPAAWARLRAGLDALRRAAADAHSELLVAIFPESWQVGVPSPNREPQQRLLALCAEAQVRCLDLLPAFTAAGDDALFIDAQHPNARGHDVAAAAIAAALRRPS